MLWDPVTPVFYKSEAEATDTNFGYAESLDVVETVAKSCCAQYPKKTVIRSLNEKKIKSQAHLNIAVLSLRIQLWENCPETVG